MNGTLCGSSIGMNQKIVLLIFLLNLVGCSTELDIYLPIDREISIECNNNTKFSINKNDTVFKNLEKWLTNNQSGWSSSPASFIGGIQVKTGEIKLNFLSDFVVVNTDKDQYTKAVETRVIKSALCKRT